MYIPSYEELEHSWHDRGVYAFEFDEMQKTCTVLAGFMWDDEFAPLPREMGGVEFPLLRIVFSGVKNFQLKNDAFLFSLPDTLHELTFVYARALTVEPSQGAYMFLLELWERTRLNDEFKYTMCGIGTYLFEYSSVEVTHVDPFLNKN
jgi:hypothetical protein